MALPLSSADVYAARGFGGRQGAGARAAVIVVDFIWGFTDRASPLACDAESALLATRTLLNAARHARIPVLFTTTSYDDLDLERAAMFVAKAPALASLRPGSRWIAVDSHLERREDEPVLKKLFASAFYGTDLDERLNAAGCDTVIVVGASTSGCVRATVVDALQNGYRVLVPREAVADRAQDSHDAALRDIDAKYGDVISIGDAVAILGRSPSVPSS